MNYRVTTEIPGDHVNSINTWLISEPVHAFMPLGVSTAEQNQASGAE